MTACGSTNETFPGHNEIIQISDVYHFTDLEFQGCWAFDLCRSVTLRAGPP